MLVMKRNNNMQTLKTILLIAYPFTIGIMFIVGMVLVNHNIDTTTINNIKRYQQKNNYIADCETLYATGLYNVHASICGEPQ